MTLVVHTFTVSCGRWEGAFSRFDIPGADNTSPNAINPAGTTTGSYFAGKNILGFVRSRKGAVTTFLPPGATSVGPTAINAEGEVTGNYSDAIRGSMVSL